ncbi:MAG TPA: LamG-like jellyroll fold domain-containing protein, partial [Candidatus Saccharimonadales bacterium]|nr:LamG-like jellyroll fold domain-containing protein [Candidatus Saccharimonadales bacterium]
MLLLFFSDAGSLNDEQAVLSPSCTLAADATVLHSGGFMDGIDEYTHLMLHFDGANGSQTIVDSSQYNHSFTASSGAVLSNTQRKFGLTSGYLPTSADYFRGDSSADLALGSGDFVVDFWVYIANDSSLAYIDWGFIYDNTKYPFLYANGTRVDWYWGGTSVIEGPTVTIGQWQHIAVVKSNNVTRIFLNGVQGGSDYADTNDYQIYTGEASPSIGALLSNEGVGQNGYYDEVRFSIGTDRGWANGFTPPKIPYTKLAAKWSPANLTSVTLEGWYRLVDPDGMAADGSDLSLSGSDVNSWADQSGNERTLNFQGTSNIVYSATSVGGGPGVTADGNSSLQTAAGMGYPANSVIGAFVLGVMSDSNAANSFNRLASFIVANGADVYNASGVVPLMANPSSGAADISYF